MVAYSFRPRFIPAIVSGVKQGTIRRLGGKRHARPSKEVQLYTGMRTQHCRLIGTAKCVSAQRVILQLREGNVYFPERVESLTHDEDLALFARRDGFSSWNDLVPFWWLAHPGMTEFAGMHIFWGDTFKPATIMQAA